MKGLTLNQVSPKGQRTEKTKPTDTRPSAFKKKKRKEKSDTHTHITPVTIL
jgi:hypothetical protein